MRRQLMLAFIMSAWISVASAGTVTISDETFENSDWIVRFDGTNVDRLDPSGGVQFPIGGNPGAFREITNAGFNFSATPGFDRILSWHLYTNQTYNPSIGGAIQSINYSEDSLQLAAPAQTGYLALKQDDLLFRSKQIFSIGSTAWETIELDGLAADDFEVLFNGSFLPTGNPDFSDSGSIIEFGVMRETLVGPRGLPRARSGLDNWQVEIITNRIPEPTSVSLVALGLLSFITCWWSHNLR